MYELTNYCDKVKLYFKDIIAAHKMTLSMFGSNLIYLDGEKCIIEFSTGRYYLDFGVLFTDPSTKKQYSLLQALEKKGLMGVDIFTKEQVKKLDHTKDEIERSILSSSFVIGERCSEILDGDFSIFE
jgi:hypothetical protein